MEPAPKAVVCNITDFYQMQCGWNLTKLKVLEFCFTNNDGRFRPPVERLGKSATDIVNVGAVDEKWTPVKFERHTVFVIRAKKKKKKNRKKVEVNKIDLERVSQQFSIKKNKCCYKTVPRSKLFFF